MMEICEPITAYIVEPNSGIHPFVILLIFIDILLLIYSFYFSFFSKLAELEKGD